VKHHRAVGSRRTGARRLWRRWRGHVLVLEAVADRSRGRDVTRRRERQHPATWSDNWRVMRAPRQALQLIGVSLGKIN
jgi:hypothetical protein